jgi:hypothetical protein
LILKNAVASSRFRPSRIAFATVAALAACLVCPRWHRAAALVRWLDLGAVRQDGMAERRTRTIRQRAHYRFDGTHYVLVAGQNPVPDL